MGNLQCIYTVQLTPRTDKSSMEIVIFDHHREEEERKITTKVVNFFTRNKVDNEHEVIPTRQLKFTGADPDTSYTVKVTLVLNGQAISVSQKSIKALMDPATQAILDAQNNALAARLQTADKNDESKQNSMSYTINNVE